MSNPSEVISWLDEEIWSLIDQVDTFDELVQACLDDGVGIAAGHQVVLEMRINALAAADLRAAAEIATDQQDTERLLAASQRAASRARLMEDIYYGSDE